jgi:sulfate adenylyltransferase subunit 1
MVTGASTANAALILIDARKGVVEQTKRHSFIASLLQVQHIIICINKMDLVDFSQSRFDEIVEEYCNFASKLAIKDYAFIPISALNGDNVVNRSNEMPWYDGPTLMYSLENIQVANDVNHLDMRFPIQTVIRPKSKEFPDFRGYAGRLAGGIVRVNDEIKVLPSGMTSTVKAIHGPKGKIEEAFAPQSITIELSDDIDISRGDMLVKVNNVPDQQQEIDAMVCWLGTNPLRKGNKYAIKHTTRDGRVIIQDIVYQTDLNSITRNEEVVELNTNDIGRIKLKSSIALIKDSYRQNKITGSFILIDEGTNNTVGAGMIV